MRLNFLIIKKGIVLPLIAAIFLLLGAAFFVFTQSTQAVGKIQVFKGTAKIIRNNNTQPGVTGADIQIEDTITTGENSRVALVLKEGTIIRLKEKSTITVNQLAYQGKKLKDVRFKLTSGQAWSRVKPLDKDSQFEVETPAVTASVRGTSFNTTLENDKTGVFVSEHAVDVVLNSTSNRHLIKEKKILWMENSNLSRDFAKGPSDPEDDFFVDNWIAFNLAEDARLCRELHDIPDCDESVIKRPTTISNTPTPSAIPTSAKKMIPAPTRTPTPTATLTPSATPEPTREPTHTPTPTPRVIPTDTPTPTKFNPNIIY